MFHQPYSSSSYFPHQPNIVHANPSSFLPFPQPVMPPAVAPEPALHPPGTDPHPNSSSVPSTYVGFDGQSQFYADPSAIASHNWVVPQPDGFTFNSLPENQITTTSSNALLNANWAIQSFGHNATWMNHVKTKFAQPVRCEVCKIVCNSKDVFDKHVTGKKHKKNLEIQNNALLGNTNINMLNQTGGTLNAPVASKNPKTKKRKLVDSGTKADSVMVCSVCNAVCNSQEVFDKHLYGKRHKAQEAALSSQNPSVAAIQPQYHGSLKKKPKKNKVVQSAWCEVCKISCNSNEIYANHLIGKKHLKNTEKVEKGKSDAAAASNAPPFPIIGPMENPATAQTPEDLETKKRKIMESGAAAGCVRTCTICNVVCNSQLMFDSHLAGQKHAAMMKKQGVLIPPLVTAHPN